MGATFSRLKTWGAEVLKYLDLNAEFDNILNNMTPAGIDDLSSNAAAMQGTQDPYPGGTASAPTSLAGELQRLRYLLAQITGKTYWYIDPDTSIAEINVILTRLQALGQWQLQPDVPTHVNGTTFTVPTDKTATYAPGRRTMCTVTAGTIYGTIVTSVFTTVTTVTVINDSGALDSGLSAVALGVLTVANDGVPRVPVLIKTASFTLAKTDFGKSIMTWNATSAATNITLPAANTFPSGFYVDLLNLVSGVLTLLGRVNGSSNPTYAVMLGCRLFSDGSNWYAHNFQRPLGTGANDACAGNDPRLSNARVAAGGNAAYATSAGSATSAGNSDTVDGFHFRGTTGSVYTPPTEYLGGFTTHYYYFQVYANGGWRTIYSYPTGVTY